MHFLRFSLAGSTIQTVLHSEGANEQLECSFLRDPSGSYAFLTNDTVSKNPSYPSIYSQFSVPLILRAYPSSQHYLSFFHDGLVLNMNMAIKCIHLLHKAFCYFSQISLTKGSYVLKNEVMRDPIFRIYTGKTVGQTFGPATPQLLLVHRDDVNTNKT